MCIIMILQMALLMATPNPANKNTVEINFDKASKFYEPGEKVSGTITLSAGQQEHGQVLLLAESYMDTVSAIRGNVGRQPLPTAERIYFMKIQEVISTGGKTGPQDPIKFSFENKATGTHPLIDAYVGVDFSIVYKVTVSVAPKTGPKLLEGSA